MTPTKIFLVDDHDIMRQGLRMVLERNPDLKVVGEASDSDEATDGVVRAQPDLVIMDIHLDTSDGIVASERVLDAYPKAKILVLSGETRGEYIRAALEVGVMGYVAKQSVADVLLAAIENVMKGFYYLCPETTTELVRSQILHQANQSKPTLTDRELELIRCVAAGLRNKEIAAQWNMSVKTVEAARSRLMSKLNCTSSAELIRYGVREQVVKL